MLSAMRYKGFIWPHNPKTFRMTYRRRVTVLDAPGGRYHIQELGKTCRVFYGEGEFYGPDAYTTFQHLAGTFNRDGAGEFVHPLWYSREVYFTRLELTQEPRRDFVAYAFEFVETRDLTEDISFASENLRSVAEEHYAVKPGDNIWSIAHRSGSSVEALLTKNPEISNPNLLRVGQEVRLG